MCVFPVILHSTFAFFLLAMGGAPFTVSIGAVIGSILPDTDDRYSNAGQLLPLFLVLDRPGHPAHRKYTHSLFGMAVFTSFALLFNQRMGTGVFFGYLLHLYGDACTEVGVPYLFYPYKYNPNHWYFSRFRLDEAIHSSNEGSQQVLSSQEESRQVLTNQEDLQQIPANPEESKQVPVSTIEPPLQET